MEHTCLLKVKTGKLARNSVLAVGTDLAYVTNGDDMDNLRLRRLIILWVSLDLGIITNSKPVII